ncbi:DUF6226 family protein [Microbacterium sp.]|uniref:DUF6226 family protein n=1 Tax=Microbacterium sp. TaxID=51671 RepID=UPI0035AEC977
MSAYARPPIDAPLIRDSEGNVIDFGRRWSGHPPEELYSVDAYPERFAPIHTIADALITHLRDAYEVEVTEGAHLAADLLHPAVDVVRAVRLRPVDPRCAPLTFVCTGYPGVVLHAGLLHDFHHPVCGCEACDSTWESEADDLERHVLAVASGHYRETIDRGISAGVGYAFTFPDGTSSGRSRARDMPAARLRAAKPILRALPDGWAPWPRAAGTAPSAHAD